MRIDAALALAGGLAILEGGGMIDNGGNQLTLTGELSGDGPLRFTGTGKTILSLGGSYSGTASVDAGLLQVDGVINGTTTVEGGATLGGNGTMGQVTIGTGGTLAPGASPGILNTGDLTFDPGSFFEVEMAGTMPGPGGYDQVVVTGTVTIGTDVRLVLSLLDGFVPAPGAYVIVDNDGSDAVQGIFSHLPDDRAFKVDGHAFTIDYQGRDGNDIVLTAGVAVTGTTGNDVIDTSMSSSASDALYGLGGDDRIEAGDGHDFLNGGTGADTMVGGAGNDVYYVDNAVDVVVEASNEGFDKVFTTLAIYSLGANVEGLKFSLGRSVDSTGIGNELANRLAGGGGDDMLFGGDGDDWLSGRLGDDTMTGGDGNDRYYVSDAGDVVVEALNEGIDTVRTTLSTYALGSNVEHLRFTGAGDFNGIGNELANTIRGAAGNDTLSGGQGDDILYGRAGDDVLDSGAGNGWLYGGQGNDAIRLDGSSTSSGLVDGGSGSDIVRSADLGQFVLRNVETLDTYYGFLNGTVKQIAAFDSYTADLADADAQIQFSLRGAGGTLDFTTGISGDNSVQVRDAGLTSAIRVTGSVNGDTLFGSGFNDTLDGGTGNDLLLGGDGRDTLRGGSGEDRLNGGNGNDKLTGGTGSDTFIFDSPIGGNTNIDRIEDFTSGTDVIEIHREYYFTGLLPGQLAAEQFAIGSATGAGPQIVYNETTGALFYDSNGADAGGATRFAILTGAPTLTASDFWIV